METYLILGNILIMESDGTGNEVGTVIVNDIVYHVTKDKRWQVSINDEKVAEDYGYFNFNVEAHIMNHQKMTAWQKTRHGFEHFKTTKDNTTVYIIADVPLFVYRADDATCWRYYTGDDAEIWQPWSPWYPAEIEPSADHFTQWVISSIEVK